MENNRILKIIKNPNLLYLTLGHKGMLNWVSDKRYLCTAYRIRTGKKLHLDNPKLYNEKIQWLKLYDRNPMYSTLVDKAKVKDVVSNIIGEKYIIPTLGVWDSFDEIPFCDLPNQFVLKCTHDSGGVVICKDKNTFDVKKAKTKIHSCMKHDYWWGGREYPYKGINPRILVEKYMHDESGTELKDYKIFCFDGVPKFIEVDFGRFTSHQRNIYSTKWEYMDVMINYPNNKDYVVEKPESLEEMLVLATQLSKGIPHVRADFYSIYDRIYFGEMTFYHGSGFETILPEEFELKMGNWIQLPQLE